MARVHPEGWRELANAGAAERELQTLGQLAGGLPDDYTVYHGVHWTRIEQKGRAIFGEIDFAIVGPTGKLLLVEQKTGFLHETGDGLVKRYASGEKHVAFQMARSTDALHARLRQFCKGETTYVDAVLDLEKSNGFGTFDPAVADALPYTNASFLEAAREAMRNGLVACSPTSGFHHAGWGFGEGFCTFNGLMIAARTLLQEQAVERIGILDCDAHYGNGTDDILQRIPKDEAARVEHYTRQCPHYGSAHSTTPEEFLAHLPVLLEGWKKRGVGLVLYQAGADPHIDDPMGGAFLTNAELRARDAIVFETCRRLGMPVAWNLAGGYQEDDSYPRGSAESIRKVLDIHDATMEECVRVYCAADRSNAT